MLGSLRSPPRRAINSCWVHAMTTLSMHTWSMMVAWTFLARCCQEMGECENWISRKMARFYIGGCCFLTKLRIWNRGARNYSLVCLDCYYITGNPPQNNCMSYFKWWEYFSTPDFCYFFWSNSRSTAANSLPIASNKSLHMCVCVMWIEKGSIESLWC